MTAEKRLLLNVFSWSPGGYTKQLRWRTRRKCGQENHVPVGGSKLFGPRRVKKALDYCFVQHFPWNLKTGSCLQIPYSISKSFVYFGETPTRAYSTTYSWEVRLGLNCLPHTGIFIVQLCCTVYRKRFTARMWDYHDHARVTTKLHSRQEITTCSPQKNVGSSSPVNRS